VPVFHVPYLRSGWDELPDKADNIESYVRRISELLGKAKRARVNRDCLEREALALREELRGYLAFFDLIAVALPESDDLDALETWIKEHEEEERQRREETARAAETVRRREQAEEIQRFLAGDPYASYIAGVSPMLRVVGDTRIRPGVREQWSRFSSRTLRHRPYRAGRHGTRWLSCREVGGNRTH
jgi:hypothetical protein